MKPMIELFKPMLEKITPDRDFQIQFKSSNIGL